MRTLIWLRSVLAAAAILAATNCFSETALTFYYPVAVGGPITKIMNDLVLDFHKENHDGESDNVCEGRRPATAIGHFVH
jgi:sn-glycerol 3-phosphate transport system substrate-binding protein